MNRSAWSTLYNRSVPVWSGLLVNVSFNRGSSIKSITGQPVITSAASCFFRCNAACMSSGFVHPRINPRFSIRTKVRAREKSRVRFGAYSKFSKTNLFSGMLVEATVFTLVAAAAFVAETRLAKSAKGTKPSAVAKSLRIPQPKVVSPETASSNSGSWHRIQNGIGP